ncbi:hypothetical protein KVI14_004503, partial [Salmonella enterica]|nr:hypothetical protein [Salmonella enterica]
SLIKIQAITNKINIKNNELQSHKIEIQDCILFGKNLSHRIKSLNESKETYKNLGQISFEYCPCCLTPVVEHSKDDTGCALCKSTEAMTSLEEKYIETLNELQYQQRQNDKIIVKLSETVEYLEDYLKNKNQELQLLQNRLFELSLVSNK